MARTVTTSVRANAAAAVVVVAGVVLVAAVMARQARRVRPRAGHRLLNSVTTYRRSAPPVSTRP